MHLACGERFHPRSVLKRTKGLLAVDLRLACAGFPCCKNKMLSLRLPEREPLAVLHNQSLGNQFFNALSGFVAGDLALALA